MTGRFLLVSGLAWLLASPAAAVDDPPVLTDFQVVTATVDSELAPATVVLSADFADTDPGICSEICDDLGGGSQVSIVHPATGQRRHGRWVFQSGTTYTSDIELSVESAGGLWQVESLWLADLAGNRQVLTTSDLATLTFDTDIQNDSTAGDVAVPVLSDVSLSQTSFDASSGAFVDVTIIASDAGSGLCVSGCDGSGGPSQIRYRNAVTGQIRDGVFVSQSGPFTARVDFPVGSADGSWTVDSLQLVDNAGNRSLLSAADLTGLTFATELTVTSSSADTLLPVFVGSSFLPDPIDTTVSGLTAVFTADATDFETLDTGVCTNGCSDFGSASQVRFRRRGSDHVRFGLLDLATGSAMNGSFDAGVDIPVSGSADVWDADQLLLVDRAGNRVFVPEPAMGAGAASALVALLALISSVRGRSRRVR